MTGLPIDFQIQERDFANTFKGERDPIGISLTFLQGINNEM